MKFSICLISLALLGTFVVIEAYPQAIGGKVTSNPAGGADARLEIAKGFGTPDHNVIATAFASGNTDKGPVTTGGNLAYNIKDFGVDLTKESLAGIRDTMKESAHANLFKNDQNRIDAMAFASQNKLANGFKYDRNGAGLDWSHIDGHGANVVLSSIPDFGKQLEVNGRANLWSSDDRNTRLDLNAGASKWLNGPFSDQRTNFGAGFGLTSIFG